MKLDFKIVEHDSPEYWSTVALRDEILRKPLDLKFSRVELLEEFDQIHFTVYLGKELIACLVLKRINEETIKMRQVATAEKYQRQGIGEQLVRFCEEWIVKNNFELIELNARDIAIPFYERMDYKSVGEEFYEVNILHKRMEKVLK